jgi:CheY-like chemotaxis protein
MALNVLIVDPSREARETLKGSLSQVLGDIVFGEAQDARTALVEIARKKVELIVANLEVPGLEGKVFLRKLYSARGDGRQPIVALLNRITPELLVEFRKDPMVWFVQKPVVPGEIAGLAGQLLQSSSLPA